MVLQPLVHIDRPAHDLPRGDVEGRQKAGGAVPPVVVSAWSDVMGRDLCVRPKACLRGFSSTESTTAWSGGLTWSPTTSRTLISNLGSRETLNVFTWCGLRPWRRRMLRTVVASMPPISPASALRVQCRACFGGGDMARSTGAFTLSSLIGFFPGGRVASRRRPSTPSARKRSRHSATPSASTCPSAESSPSDRGPSRAQALCAPARRASEGSADGPRPVRNGGGRTISHFRKKWNLLF